MYTRREAQGEHKGGGHNTVCKRRQGKEKHSSLERLEDKMGWGRGMRTVAAARRPQGGRRLLTSVLLRISTTRRWRAYAEPFSFAAFVAVTASTLTLS